MSSTGLLDEDNIPWLLNMLKEDIFTGQDKVTKLRFMEIRGESQDKNAFWRVISQVAIEKFNMREVFNMNSTVRLTAIEKLGKGNFNWLCLLVGKPKLVTFLDVISWVCL